MKNLALIIALGVIAWLVWGKLSPSPKSESKEVVASSTPSPSASPVPISEPTATPTPAEQRLSDDQRIPLSFRQAAMRAGTPQEGLAEKFYSALAKMEPLRLFKGQIIQHLDDGDLLVDVWTIKPGVKCVPRGVIAVFGIPRAEDMADQMEIDCNVFPVGTYQYTSVDGARRTIYEYIYMPKDTAPSAPTPRPTPFHLSNFPPGVDTPEQRRAYLQQRIDARSSAHGGQ